MKIFLTNYKIQSLFIISFATFFISFLINDVFNFPYLLQISGFFLALFIPGISIKNIIHPDKNLIHTILAAPIFTIFFFIPFYFLISKIFHGKIDLATAFLTLVVIALISIIWLYKKEKPQKYTYTYDKYLFFGIGIFILVHLFTTLAYKFVPEIDGYSDIIKIQNIISSGIFNVTYRPLFTFFASYLSTISQISPYWLFKFGMITVQISTVYYFYQIIKTFDFKNYTLKYLLLLTLVSIPVINLEIDYVRPNIIFLAGLIPFIYYLSTGLDGNKKFLIISSIISIFGTMYHEFFIFLFILNFIFISLFFWKKTTPLKKIASLTIIFIFSLFLILQVNNILILKNLFYSLINLLDLLANGITWKWWHLSTYLNMDGNNLDWSGFGGALKYYAYFLSPLLSFVFIFYAYLFVKKIKKDTLVTNLEKVTLSILAIGLIFAELFPRIDFKTLPDRFWPMISFSLIILFIPLAQNFQKILTKKIFLIITLILITIGIGGSVYIAKMKSGYTSNREHLAALWIRDNTPENAVFITQSGNGAMLDYFAQRDNVVPSASFFIPKNKILEKDPIKKSDKFLKNATEFFSNSLKNPTEQNLLSLNSNLKAYYAEKKEEELTEKIDYSEFKLPLNKNIYILYSFDKFKNYYVQREWWKKTNFYEADLNKFNDTTEYELVYNDANIIYIWKKKNN